MNKLITWIVSKLMPYTYKEVRLDAVNKKLIEPVMGLVLEYHGKKRQMWKYVNEVDMPVVRKTMFVAFSKQLALKTTDDLVVKYLDDILDANKENDSNRIAALAFMLKDTVQNCTDVEALYRASSVLYFDDAEDVATYDADYNLAKLEAMRRHPDQAFFLRTLLRHLGYSETTSLADTLSSLTAAQVKLKTYERMRSELSPPKTTTPYAAI